MRKLCLLILTAVLLFTVIACNDTPVPVDKAQQHAKVVQDIEQTWADHIKLWEQGDAKGCAAFYTEDMINMPSYNSTQNGLDELLDMFTDFMSKRKVDVLNQTTIEVFVHDSMAYEFGSFEQKITYKDTEREPVISKCRYISVFKKQPDGSWKWHRWMSQPKPREL